MLFSLKQPPLELSSNTYHFFASVTASRFNIVAQVSKQRIPFSESPFLPSINLQATTAYSIQPTQPSFSISAVGRHCQHRLLSGTANPGHHPSQHWRQQWRRVHGIKVRRFRLPRRDSADPRRHQQPLHLLAIFARTVRRALEYARY